MKNIFKHIQENISNILRLLIIIMLVTIFIFSDGLLSWFSYSIALLIVGYSIKNIIFFKK